MSLLAVLALVGAGVAVKWGEDGQVGTSNVLSTWLFVMAGLVACYDVIVLLIVLMKGSGGEGGADQGPDLGKGAD